MAQVNSQIQEKTKPPKMLSKIIETIKASALSENRSESTCGKYSDYCDWHDNK